MARQLAIGVDVGGTKVLAAVVTSSGEVVDQVRSDTPAPTSPVADLEACVAAAVTSLTARWRVTGVGVAAAGLVDAARQHVVFAPHLAWRGEPVRARLETLLGQPVELDNDANCAALAEAAFGAAKDHSSALVITLGTGIGGAVVMGGQLWRGANGMAGEFGHMQVVPDGVPCECGGHGCWEQYSSGRALARLAGSQLRFGRQSLDAEEAGQHLPRAALAGDPQACHAYDETGRWLGRGMASLVSAFDPEVVVVGGGASEVGDLLLEPARRAMAAEVVGGRFRVLPPLVPAQLGNAAGAIGAARLILN